MTTSDTVLARLVGLHPKLIDLSLERIEGLLARLGNPERRLAPVIHVAGTNGKGSVIAFLRAMLEAAGHKVHVYTSPHLVRFHERIRVAGQLIGEDDLVALLEECERANDGAPITFFEITTAAAFLAFARTPADVVLLETGLGGRLDATNVVVEPAVCALTHISLDHQQFLGDDLIDISREKAGILKRNAPCVVAKQGRLAQKMIETRAKEAGAPLSVEGRDWTAFTAGDGLVFKAFSQESRLPLPGLAGAHQIHNAAQALACLDLLAERTGIAVPPAARALGMRTVQWPARLQRLSEGPLAAGLPEGWELWLDGGHNPGAATAIAHQSRAWRDRPLYLVLGMMQGKDATAFLKNLQGRAFSVRTVDIPGEENGRPADDLAGIARSLLLDARACGSVADAVADLVATRPGPARILICGSLYLAGRILADNG